MKLSCDQKELAKALSLVGHAVSGKTTLPILQNILLTADGQQLKISSTNLEIAITYFLEATIFEAGSTTIPAKIFSELVSSLPAGPLEIASSPETHIMNISAGRKSNANVRGLNPDEYPLIPGPEKEESFLSLESNVLKEMINQTAFAAAEGEQRPVLTGVLVEAKENILSFSAADSFCCAIRKLEIGEEIAFPKGLIVPAKTLTHLASILPAKESVDIFVSTSRSQIVFHTEKIDFVSRLIEGVFPDVNGVAPRNHTTRAILNTKEFAAAVKMINPFARDNNNITQLKLNNDLTGGTLTLSSQAEDLGDNIVTIEASIEGPEVEIIFGATLLLNGISVINTQQIALEINTSKLPGVLRPVGDSNYTYVIMPMARNN